MVDQRYFLDVSNSALGKKWLPRLERTEIATQLSQQFDLPDIVARSIAGRNIEISEVENFLNPTLRALMPDPYSMMDVEKAAHLICEALLDGKKIGLLGDYDVDGATSTAQWLRFIRQFKALNPNLPIQDPIYYIPDREKEGYGPSKLAMDYFAQNKIDLVITLDCGVLSYEPIDYANQLGLDVIVMDHHLADEKLPDAKAVVNPNRQDDLSDLGHLAACGVIFVCLVAVNRVLREEKNIPAKQLPNLIKMLDLVALGTVCDVVSLTGLNRAFVTQGLKIMNDKENLGINALCEVANVHEKISSYHLGYVIGPRINAGGRVGESDLGSEILSTLDEGRAQNIAVKLDQYNQERQNIEQAVLDAAFYQAEQEINGELPHVIVVADQGWHQGVIGIVAGRIKDKYNRPTIVIGLEGSEGKGSGRSIKGVDLGSAIKEAVEAGVLIKGGGHAMAAGMSLNADKLAEFRSFIEQNLEEKVSIARQNLSIKIDGALTASAAKIGLMQQIKQLEPFGVDNPKPVFAFPSHQIAFAKIVGKGHLKLSIKSSDGSKMDAIAFGAEDSGLAQTLLENKNQIFHFVGNLSINRWQGREMVQLQVIDVAKVGY